MFDVLIIGAGIAGTMIARMLSKYNLSIAIVDKENDVGNATSMANSGIVHGGYDAAYGTNKGYFNVRGNQKFEKLTEELDVPFKKTGSMVLAFSDEEMDILKELYDNGLKNGVKEMSLLNKEEVIERERNISDKVMGALLSKTAGIVSPWELAIKACENAMENGAKLYLNETVLEIKEGSDIFEIVTNNNKFTAKCIVNCAGVYADEIHNMLGKNKKEYKPSFSIKPRKGQYYLLDKEAGNIVNTVLFQCPTKKGKGVLVAPTVHGNLLVGPDSEFISDKDDLKTTREALKYIRETAIKSVENIPFEATIRTFAGIRASGSTGDFIIEPSPLNDNFINVAGYESPGLASIPAVSEYVEKMVVKRFKNIEENKNYNPKNRKHIILEELKENQKIELVKENPDYGQIVCRCESITEGEIKDVINRKAGATTVKGVKKRTRAGAGRCQGGFCGPRVLAILGECLDKKESEINYDSKNSYLVRDREEGNPCEK